MLASRGERWLVPDRAKRLDLRELARSGTVASGRNPVLDTPFLPTISDCSRCSDRRGALAFLGVGGAALRLRGGRSEAMRSLPAMARSALGTRCCSTLGRLLVL